MDSLKKSKSKITNQFKKKKQKVVTILKDFLNF